MPRASARLVVTSSSETPPPDETRTRWRRRPLLAVAVRAVAVFAPLVASVLVGIVASRQFRPHGWPETIAWAIWTASASLLALWLVDVVARRLLPLHRLLQLCLAFPDRAPSRLKVAVRAARSRRPESLAGRPDVPQPAAAAAEQVVTLLAALAMHDRRTRGHCERVCAFTDLLADQMHLGQEERDRLTWVSLVHDIGKLHVPARLLNKPGRPTVGEWQLLKTHPERGAAITEPLRDWLGPAADAVLQHHERFDGAGYPHGIAGGQISVEARIIAVTDAFEVMTAPRAYRRPVDAQTARAELARHAGTQFDPEVVRSFLAVGLPQLRRAMGPIAWLAELPFVSSWPRLEAATSTTAAHAAAATAAASTAGLLALSSGGAATAQAATLPEGSFGGGGQATTVSAPLSLDHHVHAENVAAVRPARSLPRARRTTTSRSERLFGLVRRGSSAAAPSLSRPAPQADRVPTHATGQTAGSTPPDQGRHLARGHDHASGWQKNWGDGGRQADRHQDNGSGPAGG